MEEDKILATEGTEEAALAADTEAQTANPEDEPGMDTGETAETGELAASADEQEPLAEEEPGEGTGEAVENGGETVENEEGGTLCDAETGGLKLGLGSVSPAVITQTPALLSNSLTAVAEEDQEEDEEYQVIAVRDLDKVRLGRRGENLTQTVEIDCSAWLETNPELEGCDFTIAAVRPKETQIYLPEITVTDSVITWEITSEDTGIAGWGRAEVRATKDGRVKKSVLFRTIIEPGLEDDPANPTTPPDWALAILDGVEAAQAAAEAAAAAVSGLAGWSLVKNDDGTVSIDYTAP